MHESEGKLALSVVEGTMEVMPYQGNLKDSGLMTPSCG